MKAIIWAGEKGEKMTPGTDLPLVMVPIAGKPLIEHQLNQLKDSGITEIAVYESYGARSIQNHLGTGISFGLNVEHKAVDYSLGSVGAVKDALLRLPDGQESLVVLSGNSVSDIDFKALVEKHEEKPKRFLTMALAEQQGSAGVIELKKDLVVGFRERPVSWLAMGIYVVNRYLTDTMPDSGDFLSDYVRFLQRTVREIKGYKHDGYWVNVEAPEAVKQAEGFLGSRAMGSLEGSQSPHLERR